MKKIKVAIQGFEGSYSHQAVKEIFEKNNLEFELVENESFEDAFNSIEKNGLGLIPVENSTAGFVEQTIDELVQNNFEIIGEYFLEINHVLLGLRKSKISDIKKVYSHKQALAQVSIFLSKNNILPVDFGDTAGGAKFLAKIKNNEIGVLGSEILSEIYGLDILKRNINNENKNTTRFFLIRKKTKHKKLVEKIKFREGKKISLVFKTQNMPAALYEALTGFAKYKINLTRIISRPVRGERFKYSFYLELDGDMDDKKIIKSLEYLKINSHEKKKFGNYSKIE